ncbi:protein ripply1 [Osmerus mordax]|uniref:protein ripply1 n=1 Tax=Osmerus mordax TaxID=8014 RepID=UPI00350EB9C8
MSSACVIVKQTPFVVAPLARPLMMDTTPTNDSYASLWRPWLVSSKEAHRGSRRSGQSCPYSRPSADPAHVSTEGKPQTFQHPVRLFWPKSKSFDYLYSDGETLLKNFPVQATISFYEESDSEDEEDEEEEEEEDWEEEGCSEGEACLKPRSFYTSCN